MVERGTTNHKYVVHTNYIVGDVVAIKSQPHVPMVILGILIKGNSIVFIEYLVRYYTEAGDPMTEYFSEDLITKFIPWEESESAL
jgi:hypothetical protein